MIVNRVFLNSSQ